MKRTAKKALSVLMVLFMLLPAVPTVFDEKVQRLQQRVRCCMLAP